MILWTANRSRLFLKTTIPQIETRELYTFLLQRKKATVQVAKTMLTNLIPALNKVKYVKQVAQELIDENIEGVISDYEPLLPDAAKLINLPLVLINHQAILDRVSIPKKNLDYYIAFLSNRFMMPSYARIITSSFYQGAVGPIIRSSINKKNCKTKPFIVVYAKENIKFELEKIIKEHYNQSDKEFIFFPNQKKDFIECLHHCTGVISSAGHQMISECLYLGKPILVLPEKYQYEQYLNALMLEETGMGMGMDRTNIKERLKIFLNKLPDFKLKKDDHRFIIKNEVKKSADLIEKELFNFQIPTKKTYRWDRINKFSIKHIRKKIL